VERREVSASAEREATREVAVRARGVTKSFPGTLALDDVGLEVAPGEIHALVGSNGSGKSTLIKVLAGVYAADAGELQVGDSTYDLPAFTPALATSCGLHFVHQQPSVFPDLTVADNLAVGRGYDTSWLSRISARKVRARAERILERFHIDARWDDSLRNLRPGTQTMVAIARALQDQEEASGGLLVLDEATAALTPAEFETLAAALRRYSAAGQAILLVSHRLEEIVGLADRATVLRDGRRVATLTREKLNYDALVEHIVGGALDAAVPRQAAPRRLGVPVLEASGLRGGSVRNVSVSVGQGEIVGVMGLAGAGCSTLMRLLFGAQRLEAGTVKVDGQELHLRSPADAIRAGIAFVPEDRAAFALFPELSVLENLAMATPDCGRTGRLRHRRELSKVRTDLTRYQVRAQSPSTPISQLSGGNQQKVVMARWLRRSPRVLLLDEPTQGVDVGARAALWGALRMATETGTGALVASSDAEELAQLCDRVVVISDGEVVRELADTPCSAEQLEHAVYNGAVAR
jgi:ribose transport system ATP-binding protein